MQPNYNYGGQGIYPGYNGRYTERQFSNRNNPEDYPAQAPSVGQDINPEVRQWFQVVDKDRSGKINAQELQAALINGEGKNFSDAACNLMIKTFDQSKSGTININEFQQLYLYVNQWMTVFRNYDTDKSGSIDETELSQAFYHMGFRFSNDFIKFLIAKSDPKSHSNMSVDDFIVTCIQIQNLTDAFRSRDRDSKGIITLGYEDYLDIVLHCPIIK